MQHSKLLPVISLTFKIQLGTCRLFLFDDHFIDLLLSTNQALYQVFTFSCNYRLRLLDFMMKPIQFEQVRHRDFNLIMLRSNV